MALRRPTSRPITITFVFRPAAKIGRKGLNICAPISINRRAPIHVEIRRAKDMVRGGAVVEDTRVAPSGRVSYWVGWLRWTLAPGGAKKTKVRGSMLALKVT